MSALWPLLPWGARPRRTAPSGPQSYFLSAMLVCGSAVLARQSGPRFAAVGGETAMSTLVRRAVAAVMVACSVGLTACQLGGYVRSPFLVMRVCSGWVNGARAPLRCGAPTSPHISQDLPRSPLRCGAPSRRTAPSCPVLQTSDGTHLPQLCASGCIA